MQEIKMRSSEKILVFMTIWVYFSLNAKYLNLPGSHVLRWVFPGMLIILTMMKFGGRLVRFPAILVCVSCAVLPSIVLSEYGKIAFIKYMSLLIVFYGNYNFFNNLDDREQMREYFNILVYVLIIYQIFNSIFVVLGINYDSGRALGITTNANTLGVYGNLSYWAIIYMLNYTNKKILKGIYSVLLLTCAYSVIASGSRTAFVVLAIDILLTGILFFRHSPFMIIFIIICVSGMYMLFTGKMTSINLIALNRLLEEGGTERTDLWQAAFNVWREHQMFGVGYTVSNLYNPIENGMAFHNSYMSYLVETGIWGCGILGMGFCKIGIDILHSLFIYSYKFAKVTNELTIVSIMLLVLLIAAWSESFLFAVGSTEGFTFWFLLSWILAYMHKMNFEEDFI